MIRHKEEHADFQRHSAEKVKETPRRLHQTTLDRVQPYSRNSEKAKGGLLCWPSSYVLPGHLYCGDTGLNELHQVVHSHVEGLLREQSPSISLTTDIWSSDVSPMSLQEFRGSHTAAALVMKYNNMLQAWQIPRERVHVVLRDNAANMAKAMREGGLLTGCWHSAWCQTSLLQGDVSSGTSNAPLKRTVRSTTCSCSWA